MNEINHEGIIGHNGYGGETFMQYGRVALELADEVFYRGDELVSVISGGETEEEVKSDTGMGDFEEFAQ